MGLPRSSGDLPEMWGGSDRNKNVIGLPRSSGVEAPPEDRGRSSPEDVADFNKSVIGLPRSSGGLPPEVAT